MKQETTGWQWTRSGPYANHLHFAPDRQTCHHLITQFFKGQMLFLTPSQQCQSTEGISSCNRRQFLHQTAIYNTDIVGWLEFNVPFQHKYGYIRDEQYRYKTTHYTPSNNISHREDFV